VARLYQIDSIFESGGEEDAIFFQKNYSKLNEYALFKEWMQSKKMSKLVKNE
jgi:hypothetical protein